MSAKDDDNQGKSKKGAIPVGVAVGAGAVGGAVAAPAVVVAGVNAAGFTSAGVAAGSIAASVQGATVASGSIFAAAQSIGATGTLAYLGLGSVAVVGAGALVGAAVVGGAGYLIYQSVSKEKEKEKKEIEAEISGPKYETNNKEAKRDDRSSGGGQITTATAVTKQQQITKKRGDEGTHNLTHTNRSPSAPSSSPSLSLSSSSSSSLSSCQCRLVKVANNGNTPDLVSGFSSCLFNVGMFAHQVLERGELYRIVLAPELQQKLLRGDLYLASMRSNPDLINGLIMNNNGIEAAAGFKIVSNLSFFAGVILQGSSLALGQYHLYELNASLKSINTKLGEILEHLDLTKLAQLSARYKELRLMLKENREHEYIKKRASKMRSSVWELLYFYQCQVSNYKNILKSKEVNEEQLIKFRGGYERFHFAWRLYQCLVYIIGSDEECEEIKITNENILQEAGEFLDACKRVKREKLWILQLLPKSAKEEKEAQEFQEWINQKEQSNEVHNTRLRSIELYVRQPTESEEKVIMYSQVHAE